MTASRPLGSMLMLKTLDILIGATTVVLMFALALTVLTQALTSLLERKGQHLRRGLASLLQQLGIVERPIAERIAGAVLEHPLLSPGKNWTGRIRLGAVIHREEFTTLLLDAASGEQPSLWPALDETARESLKKMLVANGIHNPAAVLRQVRMAALQLEAGAPELANDVRQSMALLREATSDYVARVNAWFDQTIDRVSLEFTRHTHYVTFLLSILVVLSVQLDMIAVVNRLAVDQSLRQAIMQSAEDDPGMQQPGGGGTEIKTGAAAASSGSDGGSAPAAGAQAASGAGGTSGASVGGTGVKIKGSYYDALAQAGLITFPFDRARWPQQWSVRKVPGMLIAVLLISLGAPFWYNILKDLLGLRSSLSAKDDAQRLIRQTTQSVAPSVSAVSVVSTKQPVDGGAVA